MTYRVIWLPEVLEELSRIWLKADVVLRAKIMAACQEIEQRLEFDPYSEGESRFGSERFTLVSPLTLTFHVDSAAEEVIIAKVRLYQKRK